MHAPPTRAQASADRARSHRPAPPEPGPVPGLPGAIIEAVYRWAVRRRNAAFDRGERVTDVGVPVISVGNLSVGGTGKTPTVAWVVGRLRDAGLKPAVAMRGYRAAGGVSDEEAEHARRLPGVPVLAGPERAAVIAGALRRGEPIDCVVLDDGFQHRFVRRDLDLVLLDATRDPFADRCLPAGWLREPVESLRRAGAVLLTHAEAVDPAALHALRERVRPLLAPGAVVACARHAWTRVETPDGPRPVEWLAGRRAHVLCGIGNPRAFVSALKAARAIVNSEDLRRDHARYTPADLARTLRSARERRCQVLVTTEKDWVKIEPALAEAERRAGKGPWPAFVRPAVEVRLEEGADALERAVLAAARPRPAHAAPLP